MNYEPYRTGSEERFENLFTDEQKKLRHQLDHDPALTSNGEGDLSEEQKQVAARIGTKRMEIQEQFDSMGRFEEHYEGENFVPETERRRTEGESYEGYKKQPYNNQDLRMNFADHDLVSEEIYSDDLLELAKTILTLKKLIDHKRNEFKKRKGFFGIKIRRQHEDWTTHVEQANQLMDTLEVRATEQLRAFGKNIERKDAFLQELFNRAQQPQSAKPIQKNAERVLFPELL